MTDFLLSMLVAMALEALIGWPAWMFSRIGHPVTWLGKLVTRLDTWLNRGSDSRRFWGGLALVVIVIGLVAMLTMGVQMVVSDLPGGWVVVGIFSWPLVAAKSLVDHVEAVYAPLAAGDLVAGRKAVSMIVGRDVSVLDNKGVARAAIESLAENSADGIVAPIFWGAIMGLPGIALYKAINTMDSMIGYRNEQYSWFGKVAARLDDVVNLLPARLTGFSICLSATPSEWGRSMKVMIKDAGKHRSPNAGWPEAAMAAVVHIRLAGPRVYDHGTTDDPFLNASGRDCEAQDIADAIDIAKRSYWLLAGLMVCMVLVLTNG